VSGSLKFRLFAGAFFFIALGIVATWISLQQIFSGYVAAQYEREMTTVIDTLAAGLEFSGGAPVLDGTPPDPRFSLPAGGRYWEVRSDDGVELRSRSLWDTSIEAASLAPSSYRAFRTGEGPDGEPMLVLDRILSFDASDGPRAVDFFAAFPVAEIDSAVADFRRELATMLGLTALLLMLAAALQVLVGLRPLAMLQAEVANVRTGVANKLRSEVPSELKPLVAEINDLLDEKAQALDRARARAADLAHGLKTPLTAILQVAETLPPDTGGPIAEHVAMIRRRADRQLQRARMGVGRSEGGALDVIAAKLVNVIAAIPASRKLKWQVDVADGLATPIDTADLAEALGNILDNARKWARSEVRLTARRRHSGIVIEVADDGPGIAAQDLEWILERGVHAGDPESETGLGLTISREIAEAYGGSLALERAPEGGLLARIVLPAAAAARRTSPA
jgi:signal transduction histidine kinase